MKTLKLHELKDQLEEILDLVEKDEEQVDENIDKNTVFLDGVSTPENGEETVTAETQSAFSCKRLLSHVFTKNIGHRLDINHFFHIFCINRL